MSPVSRSRNMGRPGPKSPPMPGVHLASPVHRPTKEALPTLDEPTSERTPRRTLPVALVVIVVAGLTVSSWHPHDPTNWFLEPVWVLIGLP